MKKILCNLFIAFVAVLSLCSFTVDQTLNNEQYNQTLCLYNDGSCVVIASGSRGTGTYTLNNGKIYITWDNGATQQGSYIWQDGRVTRACIEGVCYDAGRRVVSRRR